MKKYALLSALGAVVGTLARYAVGLGIDHTHPNDIPWAILLVNIVGAFLIGVFAAVPAIMNVEERRYFLVTGVLGGFTTYSAFAIDVLNMNLSSAAIYVGVTFVAGIAATHVGAAVVRS